MGLFASAIEPPTFNRLPMVTFANVLIAWAGDGLYTTQPMYVFDLFRSALDYKFFLPIPGPRVEDNLELRRSSIFIRQPRTSSGELDPAAWVSFSVDLSFYKKGVYSTCFRNTTMAMSNDSGGELPMKSLYDELIRSKGNVAPTDCYHGSLEDNGYTYRGTANTTISGRPCLPWNASGLSGTDVPLLLTLLAPRPEGFSATEANYCRNPLYLSADGPFCLTDTTQGYMERCDIPTCVELNQQEAAPQITGGEQDRPWLIPVIVTSVIILCAIAVAVGLGVPCFRQRLRGCARRDARRACHVTQPFETMATPDHDGDGGGSCGAQTRSVAHSLGHTMPGKGMGVHDVFTRLSTMRHPPATADVLSEDALRHNFGSGWWMENVIHHGCLLGAGAHGRVYQGIHRGSPAAFKIITQTKPVPALLRFLQKRVLPEVHIQRFVISQEPATASHPHLLHLLDCQMFPPLAAVLELADDIGADVRMAEEHLAPHETGATTVNGVAAQASSHADCSTLARPLSVHYCALPPSLGSLPQAAATLAPLPRSQANVEAYRLPPLQTDRVDAIMSTLTSFSLSDMPLYPYAFASAAAEEPLPGTRASVYSYSERLPASDPGPARRAPVPAGHSAATAAAKASEPSLAPPPPSLAPLPLPIERTAQEEAAAAAAQSNRVEGGGALGGTPGRTGACANKSTVTRGSSDSRRARIGRRAEEHLSVQVIMVSPLCEYGTLGSLLRKETVILPCCLPEDLQLHLGCTSWHSPETVRSSSPGPANGSSIAAHKGCTLDQMPHAWQLVLKLQLAIQVVEGVMALHAVRLVHCDIKLDNILITGGPAFAPFHLCCKVADLDACRLLSAGEHAHAGQGPGSEDLQAASAAQSHYTTCMKGTPGYLAPEMVLSGRVAPHTDVYSLSVTVSILLSAAPVFRGTNALHVKLEPDFHSELQPHLTRCLRLGLLPDPLSRPHLSELRAALRAQFNSSLAAARASMAPRSPFHAGTVAAAEHPGIPHSVGRGS